MRSTMTEGVVVESSNPFRLFGFRLRPRATPDKTPKIHLPHIGEGQVIAIFKIFSFGFF